MGTVERVGDLELPYDPAFTKKNWRAERAGWLLLLLIVTAALLGAFGRGWASRATVTAANGRVQVDYERFTRLFSDTELRIRAGPGTATQDTLRLWIDREFVQQIHIQSIEPEPTMVQAARDELVYLFPIPNPNHTITVRVLYQPDKSWMHRGRVGLASGAAVRFTQFVYP